MKTDQTQSTRSLFAQSKMKKSTNPVAVEAAAGSEFGESSCIIRNDKRQDIHSENVEFLKQHSEEDILMEQQRLLGMMGESDKMGLNLFLEIKYYNNSKFLQQIRRL